jgi:hypothetical protein
MLGGSIWGNCIAIDGRLGGVELQATEVRQCYSLYIADV